MNFLRYIIVLCLVYSTNSTLIRTISQTIDNKLLKSICKVINDITDQRIQTQDILIGRLEVESRSFDDSSIIKCISNRHPAVVSDLMNKMTTKYLRKASLVILMLDNNKIDRVCKLWLG